MADNDLITKITEIIIDKTVNQKIPTLVFMLVKREELVRNLFWSLKSGNKDESTFTQEDWMEVSEIMEKLSGIPLLLKETADIDYIRSGTETFINGMDGRKGLIIINSKENISEQDFIADKGNISIMIL